MADMMGAGMGAWVLLWIILGLAVAVAAGAVAAAALRTRREADRLHSGPAEPSAVQRAKDELRLRYSKGEINREEYLQGKVDLED